MRIYLAGIRTAISYNCFDNIDMSKVYVLESFANIDKSVEPIIGKVKGFLLDSGAYTFFGKKSCGTSWEEYTDRYCDFIKRHNIEFFFELDIDALIGYENVLKLRKRIETSVGRQCIPVWHNTRGKEEYIKMCSEYPYVAIGGLVGSGSSGASEYSKKVTKYFPWFINTARKSGAKIHALGYTSVTGLKQYHFDSVDSTAWLSGNKFGTFYYFNGKAVVSRNRKIGERVKVLGDICRHNFAEWVKYQEYADTHL